MKIALAGNAASHHVHRWAMRLAARGHDVRVFSDTSPQSMNYGAVRIVPPEWSLIRKTLVFGLRRSVLANNRHKWLAYARPLREFAPDVLHVHEALAYGVLITRFADQYATVLTPWGSDVESITEGASQEHAELVRDAFRHAAMITTNAPGMPKRWSEITGADAGRMRFFPWGVDADVFCPMPREESTTLLDESGLDDPEPFLFAPRGLREVTRPSLIIDAHQALKERGVDPPLLMTSQASPGELQAFLQTHSRHGFTLLDGTRTPRTMAALYQRSTAVVNVPRRDLLAATISEALACGAVLITPLLPCYESALCDLANARDDRGWCVVPKGDSAEALADAIQRVVALSADEHTRIAEHNMAFARRFFDWERAADQMEAVYVEAHG